MKKLDTVTSIVFLVFIALSIVHGSMDWGGTLEGLTWSEKILEPGFVVMHGAVLFLGALSVVMVSTTAIIKSIARRKERS